MTIDTDSHLSMLYHPHSQLTLDRQHCALMCYALDLHEALIQPYTFMHYADTMGPIHYRRVGMMHECKPGELLADKWRNALMLYVALKGLISCWSRLLLLPVSLSKNVQITQFPKQEALPSSHATSWGFSRNLRNSLVFN